MTISAGSFGTPEKLKAGIATGVPPSLGIVASKRRDVVGLVLAERLEVGRRAACEYPGVVDCLVGRRLQVLQGQCIVEDGEVIIEGGGLRAGPTLNAGPPKNERATAPAPTATLPLRTVRREYRVLRPSCH